MSLVDEIKKINRDQSLTNEEKSRNSLEINSMEIE